MEINEIASSTGYSKAYTAEKVRTWVEETGITNRHPRILLTSVFGPYAQDDEFGSRTINPMELFHNQVTRMQGVFSFRYFHNSWGIVMIQANISAPSTVLDFPTLETFKKELTSHQYDIVGITSIVMNVGKVQEMCRIIRQLSPHSKIVVGGHVAAIFGLEKLIDADHIVRGDGISWMRCYVGEDERTPIHHPPLPSAFGFRILGIPIPKLVSTNSATIIPAVGCPMGCNFCATSAFFGGKGKVITYLKTGEELFKVMCEAEAALKTPEFFIMDENFLLKKPRAMELLELMRENDKSWSFYIFSSANAIQQYTMDELVELGLSWLWIGLESPRSSFAKLKDTDTKKLVKGMQEHGIRVLGSTIVGLDHHTPKTIIEEIEYAVSHNTDFHQFMLSLPFPGTPLYAEREKQDRLLKDVDIADMHGQYKFHFKHPHISREDSKKYLDHAFQRDFERNGPSLFRMLRTMLKGYKRYKNHPDERVRRRFEQEAQILRNACSPFSWAMEQMYKDRDRAMAERIRALRLEVEEEFGLSSHIWRLFGGPVILWAARREEERLARGVTYEPQTFIERKNWTPG